MYTAISVLIVIVCILLILIVLVQNSKIMGVRKTTDFLEKATWTLAGAMLVLCVIAALAIPRGEVGGKSAIQEQILNAPANQIIPSFGTEQGGAETTPATTTPAPAEEQK